MICVLALVVFGILGIFSATHRKIAAEAFDCVFRRITLRKCESGLDQRLKAEITGKLMKKSPKTAKFTFKYFEAISWFFTILLVVSLAYSLYGGYNYYLYGNCNGPQDTGFCIFDPSGHGSEVTQAQEACGTVDVDNVQLSLGFTDLSTFQKIDNGAPNVLVFIGCYGCRYTREILPTITKLLKEKDTNFIFAHFPADYNTKFLSTYSNCIYAQDKREFWKFHEGLFKLNLDDTENSTKVMELVDSLDIDADLFNVCVNSEEALALTDKQVEDLANAGIYGTPTVFVNGEAVVGPKAYRVYERLFK